MEVTALAGGTGGAKLLVGLQRALPHACAIVNTGDDDVMYGVHVSPDVDMVTYWTAGLADTERGWGLAGDTFQAMDQLRRLDQEVWFNLGDRDLATCLSRTLELRAGATLTQVTDRIRRSLGVAIAILPMSDDPVRTRIVTKDGRELSFQEYFVRERHAPPVAEVLFAGIAAAKPSPAVLDAISTADTVVICPSNPIVSIGPVLALPEVRAALVSHPRVIAVSPIIRGAALKGPAEDLLRSAGIEVSASGVASLYRDFVNVFVVDGSDPEEIDKVAALGIEPFTTDTLMVDHDAAERLVRAIL